MLTLFAGVYAAVSACVSDKATNCPPPQRSKTSKLSWDLTQRRRICILSLIFRLGRFIRNL